MDVLDLRAAMGVGGGGEDRPQREMLQMLGEGADLSGGEMASLLHKSFDMGLNAVDVVGSCKGRATKTALEGAGFKMDQVRDAVSKPLYNIIITIIVYNIRGTG